ncbi:MAG: hypothetical protein HY791_10965 [Deltaproteobacteria bacterium]|nr:hypothetical protein [Deltaproteobacteria bacterium]
MLNKIQSGQPNIPVADTSAPIAPEEKLKSAAPLAAPPLQSAGGASAGTKAAGQKDGPSSLVAAMALRDVSDKQLSLAEAQQAKDPSVTRVFQKPTKRTSTTVTFKMPDQFGTELKPGERWLFEIPEDLRGTPIRTAVLAHRKDSKYADTVEGKWDKEGAYNLVTARKSGSESWVTWRDQYGSKKFAEPRSSHDPENENLHDWMDCVGPTNIDLLAVTGVGQGAKAIASVHFLEIEFFPSGKKGGEIEEIFTKGTAFVDPEKGIRKPRYGGGQAAHFSEDQIQKHGLYPGSVELGGYGAGEKKISEHARVDSQGRLHIKLPEGKVFGSLEVSVGDTSVDTSRPLSEQKNQDGHIGRLGFAKLYAHVERADGSKSKPFMENVNVPPSGVLSGGPAESGISAKAGDEIVITSQAHKSWVMGYRVTLLDAEPKTAPAQRPSEAQRPAVSASPQKPIEVQKPFIAAPTQKPIEAQKPVVAAPTQKPIEAQKPVVITPKPIDIQKPGVSAPAQKPIEAPEVQKQSVAAPIQKPVVPAPTTEVAPELSASTPAEAGTSKPFRWWNPVHLFQKLVSVFKKAPATPAEQKQLRTELDGVVGPLANALGSSSDARSALLAKGQTDGAPWTASMQELDANAQHLADLQKLSDQAIDPKS